LITPAIRQQNNDCIQETSFKEALNYIIY
jgi:hypothetical protein